MAITGEVPGFSGGQIQAGLQALGATIARWVQDSTTILVVGQVYEDNTLPWSHAKGEAACHIFEAQGGADRLRLVSSVTLLEIFRAADIQIHKMPIGKERSFAKNPEDGPDRDPRGS